MKKLACTLVFVLFVALAFTSVSAAVTVRVDPPTIVLPAVGNTFNIDIVIDDVADLGGFEFDLQYNPSIVTIENSSDVSLETFLGSTGRTTSLLGPTIDNSAGLLETGAFSYGDEAGPNGSGILIKITFTVQSMASGTLDLKNVILADTSANSITVDAITDSALTGNQPPTADAGPDRTVYEGVTVTLDGSNSTDPDDGIASYQWTQTAGTSVTLSDPTAVKPTFTAPGAGPDGESLTFELAVTDNGGLQDTDTCIVNVTSANQPPIADAGSDQTVDEGVIVTLDGSKSSDPDPDDGIASYLWTQAAGNSIILSDATAVQPTFISPQVGPDGEAFTFQLTVVDNGGLQASDTCMVNVTWENNPPTADAGPDQTVYEEMTVILNGSNSSDPDGTTASYLWTQTAGTSVTISDPTAVKPTFTAPDAETSLTFQLTVTDDGGLQGTDTCVVHVNAIPTAEDEEDDIGVCFIATAAFGSLLE